MSVFCLIMYFLYTREALPLVLIMDSPYALFLQLVVRENLQEFGWCHPKIEVYLAISNACLSCLFGELLHFVNWFIVSSGFLCKINFPFSLICLWYLIIVGSNSWKEGLSLPPKQWFVCPKWKKICYHLNRLLDRNGWTTCVFKFCNGSCPNAETLWHSLLGRFSFSCLIYILLNNAWIISVIGKNVFD